MARRPAYNALAILTVCIALVGCEGGWEHGGDDAGDRGTLSAMLARSVAAARRANPDAGIAGVDEIYRMSAAMQDRATDGIYPGPRSQARGVHEATEAVERIMGSKPSQPSKRSRRQPASEQQASKHVQGQKSDVHPAYLQHWMRGERTVTPHRVVGSKNVHAAALTHHQLLAEAPIKVTASRLVASTKTASGAQSAASIKPRPGDSESAHARTPSTVQARVVGVPTWVQRLAHSMGHSETKIVPTTGHAVENHVESKGWATELPEPSHSVAAVRVANHKETRWGALRHELRRSVAPKTTAAETRVVALKSAGDKQHVDPLAKQTALNEYDDAIEEEDEPEPDAAADEANDEGKAHSSKKEEKKKHNEEKEEKAEEAKEHEKEIEADAEKVAYGIEIASQKEQEDEILRCHIQKGTWPKVTTPPNVSVGLFLLNLEAENSGLASGIFYADFLLFLRQGDAPLEKFERQDPMKQLAFSNAKGVEKMQMYSGGVRRIEGDFFFSPDMRWFPFDEQQLEVVLEQLESPIAEFDFVPDYNLNGMSPSVRFPGWQASLRQDASTTANCFASTGTKVYPGASRDSASAASNITFSTFKYTIRVQRPVYQGVITHFVPPAIMLSPTLYSYMLDPVAHWSTRVSLGSGGLMSVVFFHSSIAGQLPPLDYLTFFDKYIFCVYVCILVQLLSSFGVAFLFRREADASTEAEMSLYMKEVVQGVSVKTLIWSVVGLFLLLLPVWMFVSSYQAMTLLVAGLLASGVLILSAYADAKAHDALTQPLKTFDGSDVSVASASDVQEGRAGDDAPGGLV